MTAIQARHTLPLESGDRLTGTEFMRRYTCHPEIKRAELIEGVVYVGSPFRLEGHAEPHGVVMAWAVSYAVRTPRVRSADNATVRLDPDNVVQPDVLLFREGGNAQLDDDDYLSGAPELVVEVAASSVSYDLHDKLRAYRRNGVLEYIVWRVDDEHLDWFRLRDGEYVPVAPDRRGVIASEAFPGLRLNVKALLAGDFAAVLGA